MKEKKNERTGPKPVPSQEKVARIVSAGGYILKQPLSEKAERIKSAMRQHEKSRRQKQRYRKKKAS